MRINSTGGISISGVFSSASKIVFSFAHVARCVRFSLACLQHLHASPLPSMLFKNVTVKVVQQERLRLPTKAGVLKLSKGIRELLPSIAAGGKQRLRIGYMSSDFGGHTVGSLIRNLLKLHNRNRCEVAGIGMMKGDGTEWNLEMQASTDKWLSIHEMTDQAAAFAIDQRT